MFKGKPYSYSVINSDSILLIIKLMEVGLIVFGWNFFTCAWLPFLTYSAYFKLPLSDYLKGFKNSLLSLINT